jgi:elongation factor 2 kinase
VGDYRKHNNNFGYVSDDERNTPQAFSHFTFEISKRNLLVVDIQGVGDFYTDPQVHIDGFFCTDISLLTEYFVLEYP